MIKVFFNDLFEESKLAGCGACILIGVFILILIYSIVFCPIASRTSSGYMTITINDKSINTQGGEGYLVFTDKGVFANRDSVMWWKWNTSDIQNQLEIGETYEVHYHWFRVPLFSWYKNILTAKEQGE